MVAYTCNAPRNQLISNDTTGQKLIFDTTDLDEESEGTITARRKKEIFTLSRRFSFKDSAISRAKSEVADQPKEPENTKPQVYHIDRKRPFSDSLFVQKIFAAWAAIIFLSFSDNRKAIKQIKDGTGLETYPIYQFSSKEKEMIDQLKQRIDLRSCWLLYLYYAEHDVWESLPDKLSWENIPSNEYLRTAFEAHFNPGSLFSLW